MKTPSHFSEIIKLMSVETKQTMEAIRGKINVVGAIGLLAGFQGVIGVLAVLISAYMERIRKLLFE